MLLWHSFPTRFKRRCYYGTVSRLFFFNASVTLTQNLDRVSTTVSLWHSFPKGFQDSKMLHRILTGFQRQCHYDSFPMGFQDSKIWHRFTTGFQRQCHYCTVSQCDFKTVKYGTDSRQGFNDCVIMTPFPNGVFMAASRQGFSYIVIMAQFPDGVSR